MAERGFQACRRPRPSAPKGLLTWAFAGAAYRNRTDDLLITSNTRVVRHRPRKCVAAGQGVSRRRTGPTSSVPIHGFGSLIGSSAFGRQACEQRPVVAVRRAVDHLVLIHDRSPTNSWLSLRQQGQRQTYGWLGLCACSSTALGFGELD